MLKRAGSVPEFKRIKRWVVISALAIIVVLLVHQVSSVYAWLASRQVDRHTARTPVIEQVILEGNAQTDIDGWEDPAGAFWGQTVSKHTRFMNASQVSVVLRVSLAQTWTLADGRIKSNLAAAGSAHEPIALLQWSPDGLTNPSRWTLGPDGWYYYRYVLSPGESTPFVLDAVHFPGAVPSGYQTARYTQTWRSEVCQVSDQALNENQQAAAAVFGMTYQRNGTQLTWLPTAP